MFWKRQNMARKRHINFEHINFLKVGTTLGQPASEPEGKVFISCVSRRTHKLFGPVNPGTTSRLSQGHLDVNQSKKLCSCSFFLPERNYNYGTPVVQSYWAWSLGPPNPGPPKSSEKCSEKATKKRQSTLAARAIRNAIRANRFARIIRNWHPYFYRASGRFARITRISDDSRESCDT